MDHHCHPTYPGNDERRPAPSGISESPHDAAFNAGNGKAYFFKGGEYVRYDNALLILGKDVLHRGVDAAAPRRRDAVVRALHEITRRHVGETGH